MTSGEKTSSDNDPSERRMSEMSCQLATPEMDEKPPAPRVLTFPSRPRRSIPVEKSDIHEEEESDIGRDMDGDGEERERPFFSASSHRRQSSVVGGKDWRDLEFADETPAGH